MNWEYDFEKLDEIQRQVKGWLDHNDHQITTVCDQLIARTFLLRPNGPINNGEQIAIFSAGCLSISEPDKGSWMNAGQMDMNIFFVQFGRQSEARHANRCLGES